jgi:hypothetical protein
MPGVLVNRTDGDADVPEACNIRVQFLDAEIDTFPAHGTHQRPYFKYTLRNESDKTIEEGTDGAFFSSLSIQKRAVARFFMLHDIEEAG